MSVAENMTYPKERKVGKKNLGLCVLRMWMCFEVVLCHFHGNINMDDNSNLLIIFSSIAVPVFIIMSFALTSEMFFSKNTQKLKTRILRLFVPQLIWALVYFIVYRNAYIDEFLGVGGVSFTDLKWQILTGHSQMLNPTMWYQAVLMVITLFIFAILFYCRSEKTGIVVLLSMFVLCFVLEYSGWNDALFSNLQYELRYPLGRLVECIPCAVTGLLASRWGLMDLLKKNNVTAILPGILALVFGIILFLYIPSPEGFGYQGIARLIIAAALLLVFWNLPFDKMPAVIQDILLKVSRFTLGIYCMHRLVGRIISTVMERNGVNLNAYILCIIVYISCYFIADLIDKLPGKFFKLLVD